MEWISTEDRLPKDGGRYWCYVEEVSDLGMSYYQWNCSYNPRHGFKVSPYSGTVKHWMPLPSPPGGNDE